MMEVTDVGKPDRGTGKNDRAGAEGREEVFDLLLGVPARKVLDEVKKGSAVQCAGQ